MGGTMIPDSENKVPPSDCGRVSHREIWDAWRGPVMMTKERQCEQGRHRGENEEIWENQLWREHAHVEKTPVEAPESGTRSTSKYPL